MTMAIRKNNVFLKRKTTALQVDRKTVGFFFLKIGLAQLKSLTRPKRANPEKKRLSSVSLSFFSLAPDLLFDCSRVLERKITDCFAVYTASE